MTEPLFDPRFVEASYGPGDMVEGALVATRSESLRALNAALSYLDRSPGYTNWEKVQAAEPLHEGPVEAGDEIPFSFQIPRDGLPALEEETISEYGRLFWGLVLETDVAQGLDMIATLRVPTDPNADWTGPEDPAEERRDAPNDFDVTITPSNWAPRRGEDLTVTVEIGSPDAERKIEVGLLCQVGFDVATRDPGDVGTTRETRWHNLVSEWPTIDAGAPTQTLDFHIPEAGPFTYAGKALGFVWKLNAKESRRFRGDPTSQAFLRVRP